MAAYIAWRREVTAKPQTPSDERVERGRRAEQAHQDRMAAALEERKRSRGG